MKEAYRHLTAAAEAKETAIGRLAEIVAILRVECPWDRVQTHESLRAGMLEEAYEVVEAIDNKDLANLREELGDVLLQVVFHAHIEEERGGFDLADVINEECEKMIRRHPHVFLEESENNHAKSIDKVLEKWENIKVQERGDKRVTSRMEKVPKALPALTRANKIQKRAAESGFDWDDISGAFDKVKEEYREVISCCQDENKDAARLKEEVGDLLFSVVNISRFLGIDPEDALNYTNNKFIRRFSHIEKTALACGRELEEMSLSEMDELWNEAKKLEHSV